jgi:hypothetical protein
VWALVENRSVVFQEAVDGALSVHGLVSVHAIDITNARRMGDAISTS